MVELAVCSLGLDSRDAGRRPKPQGGANLRGLRIEGDGSENEGHATA